jgi:hypothetical protein
MENSRHQCLIYDGPPSRQLPLLALVIEQKLKDGYRCLYLNSPPMVAGLRSSLMIIGVDAAAEVSKARLVLSSDSVVSPDGIFDIDLMLQQLEDAVKQSLSDGHKGLWATGDMTWEFGSEKNFSKLLEYEYRLEKLFIRQQALSGICQYHIDTMPPEVPREALLAHRTFFINETLSRLNPQYDPLGQPADHNTTMNSRLDEAISELCKLQKSKSVR